MRTILFFGTFPSKVKGTKGPSETIAKELEKHGTKICLVSALVNPIGRLLHALFVAIFFEGDIALVDVYSSRVLWQTKWICAFLSWRKIPYVAVLHGGAIPQNWEQIKSKIEYVLNRAKCTYSPSNFVVEFVRNKGFAVNYIPNPVDTSKFPFQENKQSHSPIRLLWVRAFTEIYRPYLPVEILDHLINMGQDAELVMVGPDSGMMDDVKQLVEKKNLNGKISFTGAVQNEVLWSYYHKSDFLLNTTKYESFGMAVAEAALCGLPVISAKVGELPYVWKHGESIWYPKDAEANSFAEALIELNGNRELYEKISIQGNRLAQRFSLDRIIRDWKAILNESP